MSVSIYFQEHKFTLPQRWLVSHPAIRKMTLRGSRAMVNRNRAMAGPKAMKVQPKNTAAVILALRWESQRPAATLERPSLVPLNRFLQTLVFKTGHTNRVFLLSWMAHFTSFYFHTRRITGSGRDVTSCHVSEKKKFPPKTLLLTKMMTNTLKITDPKSRSFPRSCNWFSGGKNKQDFLLHSWEVEKSSSCNTNMNFSLFVIPPMSILSRTSHISLLVFMFCYTVTFI